MARTRISSMCALDLDLEDLTLDKGHDTPLRHGQQLCEILSRSNLAVRSYDVNRRTDRRTDREGDSYIPPNFVCRGYKE